MYQQTNVNEILPSQGDTIDEHFAKHYKASLRTAYRILRSREHSDDVVQTAYCAAFQHFHSFRGESSLKTWIMRIVVNCCLTQSRERPQLALDDILLALESHAAAPEALCFLPELQAAHATAASRLPKVLHDVYVKSVISRIVFSKVVHHHGLSPAAAKSRLFRAPWKGEHVLQLVIQGMAA